jgi:hypothetical protein
MSKVAYIVALFVVATMAAAAADWYWSFRPMGFVSILGDVNNMDQSEIDFIHENYPLILLQPEWFKGQEAGVFARWSIAEMETRFFLVFIGWVTCVFFISRNYHRSRALAAAAKYRCSARITSRRTTGQ